MDSKDRCPLPKHNPVHLQPCLLPQKRLQLLKRKSTVSAFWVGWASRYAMVPLLEKSAVSEVACDCGHMGPRDKE